MGSLATVEDLEALGVTVEGDERPIVERYLAVASASVREAAGCPISQGTSTVVLAGQREERLPLPGPPITSVDTVLLDDAEASGWRLSRPRASLYRAAGWGSDASEVEVTYIHGLPEVPADIIALVCRIAATTLMAWRSDETGGGLATKRVTQLRIGDYSASFADDGTLTEIELPETTRSRLRARFGGGAAVMRTG
ncbi:hypothetical protein J4H86_21165 [Spiractinospora alimapuensis]|uniref:hypothetical protein n=1 Tax=Spiractinospora alimapuensis TaxID=2820884 RepID=UPI001F3596D3|nr:hypothetical protein [Spiractinospora alimapuensis]QVQ51304.1 hypothetical protein J4H86_21165 [Spiractinospora alimapuensis]